MQAQTGQYFLDVLQSATQPKAFPFQISKRVKEWKAEHFSANVIGTAPNLQKHKCPLLTS